MTDADLKALDLEELASLAGDLRHDACYDAEWLLHERLAALCAIGCPSDLELAKRLTAHVAANRAIWEEEENAAIDSFQNFQN